MVYLDGQTFAVSAPPMSNSTGGPSDTVNQLSGSIMNAIFFGVKTFTVLSLILVAWGVGKQYGQGASIVLSIVTAISYGTFPIFIMPIGIFFWRLFVDHDVIVLT